MSRWIGLPLVVLMTTFFTFSGEAQAQLEARVEVSLSPSVWSYTLFNEEAVGSPNHIAFFP